LKNGLIVKVPSGYDVFWIRIPNDVFDAFIVYPADSLDPYSDGELYSGGKRRLVEIAPDGGG
jgi:hypothetical protein